MESKQTKEKWVLFGLLLSIFAASMDNTIVATAMGTIVGELGGLDQFVWVTSAYMVASMAVMPIFGRLSDQFGRKRFFLLGVGLFLLGSVLCGTADSIVELSIYRAIQGIGGGALMPIAFTIVFDAFPPEKRGKMTAIVGATFGISAVFGPLLGAFITDNASWQWIFYINLPIGLLSLFMITRFYHESNERKEQSIDWGGAVTLVGAIVSLMFALELGGKKYAWDSMEIMGLFASFILLFICFILFERKAKEPIISFGLFKNRLFATSQALAFLYGAAFVSLSVFIPIFAQAVDGGTATNAGLILMPMMIGSVFGSGFAGGLQTKTTFRSLMTVSVVTFILGLGLLSQITPDTTRFLLGCFMFMTGFGVGFSFSLLPVTTMHNLPVTQRGSASSTNAFFRSLGMTVGITIWGTIQNNVFAQKLKESFEGIPNSGLFTEMDMSAIFAKEVRDQMPPNVLHVIITQLTHSISTVFFWATLVSLIAIPFVYLLKKDRVIVNKEKTEETKEA